MFSTSNVKKWKNEKMFFYFYAFLLFALIILLFKLLCLFYLINGYFFIILMSSFIFSYFSFSLAIVLNSSWLISKSKNASDNKISRLFNLLLARITILLCLFVLFLVIFNSFYIIYFVKENTRVKLAIPTETAVTHAKEYSSSCCR